MKKRGAFFWNMAGCTVNAGATVVLLAAVTRICGAEEGGVFSIAFVTAQMLMTLGAFGVRAYQASDMEEEFTFPQYLTHRLLTCALMVCLLGLSQRLPGGKGGDGCPPVRF